MADSIGRRFEKLKEYVAGLSQGERDEYAAKGQAHENAVFDMIKEGDGVGLYASVQKDPSLLERQDENGMTPLHWSGADRSGLTYEITTSQPSNAPWMRDNHDRLPLDVAQEAGREQDALKLERTTYPQLYRHETNSPEQADKMNGFYEQHKKHGRADTSPSNERMNNTQDKERKKEAERKPIHREDKGRER